MKEDNHFAKGAILVVLSALLVKIIGVVYKIPLSYALSDEGMGYFNSAYTIFSFFYIIAGAGVPKAISILISNCDENSDKQRSYKIYSAAIKFFTLCGILCTLIFLMLSKPISLFLKNGGAFLSMISIAPSVFFICASSVIRGYFTGKMKFIPCAVSELLASLGKLVFGLIFAFIGLRFTNEMVYISAFTIFGTTIGAFISWFYLYISIKNQAELQKRDKIHKLFSSELREILSISIPLTLSAFVSSISSVLDLAIFMRTLNSDGYTSYQASVLYGNYSTLVIPMLNSVSAILSPILLLLVPLVGRDRNLNKNSDTVRFIVKSSFIFSSFATVILLFESNNVLSLLFENTSAKLAAPVLSYMAPGIFFMCILLVINTLLEGTSKIKVPLVSLLLATVIKSALSAFMLRNAIFGIAGAAVSISISYAAALVVSGIYLTFEPGVSKIKVFRYAISTLLVSVISYALTSTVFSFLKCEIFIIKTLTFCIIYALFDYIFIFNNAEKKKFWLKLTKKSV